MYMVNASWDWLFLIFIVGRDVWIVADQHQAVFWVETKGLSLEEVDALFDGEKHSSVPNIEAVEKGEPIGAVQLNHLDHNENDKGQVT
jgi:hypothetical protein